MFGKTGLTLRSAPYLVVDCRLSSLQSTVQPRQFVRHVLKLGTISSSVRFKEDIHDMADGSQRLLQLRPVTFRYTQPYANGAKPIQFGLVAEEVAEVFPELAVRDANGNVETVHYETLNVLLLNEVQKQQHELTAEQTARQEEHRAATAAHRGARAEAERPAT
jgi:hypothetical protein